jgi:transcriptional regulator with XRE-family HTH domain
MAKYDLGIAGRFKEFRKKYVANNMNDAAEVMGISKSTIGRIEQGEDPIPLKVITLLQKKFNLNRDWLLESRGNPVKDNAKPKNTITYLEDINSRIDSLATEVLILNKNLNKAWQIIEQQGHLIEQLRNKTK